MMIQKWMCLGLALALIMACNDQANAPATFSIAEAEQLVVVQGADWNESFGTMYTFERDSPEQPWQEAMSPFPVVLGLSGLAWGNGLEDYRVGQSHTKIEGDKRSPAGIFRLSSAFGSKSPGEAAVTNMPYQQITETTRCIEDGSSAHYNSIVDERLVDADWDAADKMLRTDSLYSWGVFVDHNIASEAEAGSCIFMHVWRGKDKGTLGCTAMEYYKMQEFVYWLKNRKHPLLVQLPKIEYLTKKDEWNLPAIP